MFETVEEITNMLGKETNDDMKKIQIKLLELKNTVSKVKIYWVGLRAD